MTRTVTEQAQTQSALRAYYQEWPQLRCTNERCMNSTRPFGGFPSLVGVVCPECAKRDPRNNQIIGVGGVLQAVPVEELVPDFAERVP